MGLCPDFGPLKEAEIDFQHRCFKIPLGTLLRQCYLRACSDSFKEAVIDFQHNRMQESHDEWKRAVDFCCFHRFHKEGDIDFQHIGL